MTLSPRSRKLALALHVTASVGWIGAVVAFLALAIAAVRGAQDETLARASYVAMDELVRWVIVPLAFAALASGLLSALGTPWGLFRHWWVLAKLALTVFAIAVLLAQLAPIGELAAIARDATKPLLVTKEAARPLVHALGGLVVLVVVQLLGIFKPKGLTRHGRRKQDEELAAPSGQPG